jgi:hypothetical protein
MFLKGGKDQPEPKKTSKEVKEDKKKEKEKGKKNAQKNFEDENDQYPMSDN